MKSIKILLTIFILLSGIGLLISPANAQIDFSFCYDAYGRTRDWTAGCIEELKTKEQLRQAGFTPVTGKCWNNPATPANECEVGEVPPDIQSSGSGGFFKACVGTKGGGASNCPAQSPPPLITPQQQEQTLSPQPQPSQTEGTYSRDQETGEIVVDCYEGEGESSCIARAQALEAKLNPKVAPPAPTTKPKTESIPTSGQREFRSLQSGQKIYKDKDVLRFDNTLRQRAKEIIKKKATEVAKKSSATAGAGKVASKSAGTEKPKTQETQIQPGAFQAWKVWSNIPEIYNQQLEKFKKKFGIDQAPETSPAPAVQEKSKPEAVPTVPPTKKSVEAGTPTSAARQAVKSALEKSLETPTQESSSLQLQLYPTPNDPSGLKNVPIKPTQEGIRPFEGVAPLPKTSEPENKFMQGKELKDAGPGFYKEGTSLFNKFLEQIVNPYYWFNKN